MKTIRSIPCKICAAPSTGFHYGALTCEACKAFFRRVLKSGTGSASLTCLDELSSPSINSSNNASSHSNQGDSPTTEPQQQSNSTSQDDIPAVPESGQSDVTVVCDIVSNSKKCPKCRFNRCLQIGMSPDASKIGRPTKGRLQAFRNELHQAGTKQEPSEDKNTDDEESRDESVSPLKRSTKKPPHISQNEPPSKQRKGKKNLEKAATTVPASSDTVLPETTPTDEDLQLDIHQDFSAEDLLLLGSSSNQGLEDLSESSMADLLLSGGGNSSFSPPQPPPVPAIHPVAAVPPMSIRQTVTSPHPQMASDPNDLSQTILTTVKRFYDKATISKDRQHFIQMLRQLSMFSKRSNYVWLYGSAERWYTIAQLGAILGCSNDEDPHLIYSKYLAEKALFNNPLSSPHSSETEANIRETVQATRYLFHLNAVPRDVVKDSAIKNCYDFPAFWTDALQVWEANTIHMITFTRNLPGFGYINNVKDRVLLTGNSLFPLLIACLSLDFDIASESPRTFWMSSETFDLVCKTYPEVKSHYVSYNQHFVDAGYAVKSANLSLVEFSFLCALVHFNPSVAGLEQPEKVAQIASRLMGSVEMYIRSNFQDRSTRATPGQKQFENAEQRIGALKQLVQYLNGVNNAYNWLTARFIHDFPILIELSGEVFKELNQKIFRNVSLDAFPRTESSKVFTRVSGTFML